MVAYHTALLTAQRPLLILFTLGLRALSAFLLPDPSLGHALRINIVLRLLATWGLPLRLLQRLSFPLAVRPFPLRHRCFALSVGSSEHVAEE